MIDGLRRIDERDSGIDELKGLHAWASKLPGDTQWFAGTMLASSAGRLVHIHAPVWATLSGDTGRIAASAEAVNREERFADDVEPAAVAIRKIADHFDVAKVDRLLLGSNRIEGGTVMVLDGNHRAVALEMLRLRETAAPDLFVEVTVAVSISVPLLEW